MKGRNEVLTDGSVRSKTQFCRCDVTNWEDQVEMFKAAISNSPQKSCDIVIANAGVGSRDNIFQSDG